MRKLSAVLLGQIRMYQHIPDFDGEYTWSTIAGSATLLNFNGSLIVVHIEMLSWLCIFNLKKGLISPCSPVRLQ
jgi:hypothetical protein